MKLSAFLKATLSVALSLTVVVLSPTSGSTVNGNAITVLINAVSGYDGHAFVYAQVNSSNSTFPAPTGTMHQSPYYAEWVRIPIGSPSCPWVWAVYVYNRATNLQINMSPPNAPPPDFGTTTLICANPNSTPVDQPPVAEASSRLDLDLDVSISPSVAPAGTTRLLTADLSSALTSDLNLYLNMAIQDWSVTSWSVDFGDGQSLLVKGGASRSLRLSHVYQSAGQVQARVTASVSGHAQAAIYDRFGSPHLVRQTFAVEVGNSASASTRAAAVKRYLPPDAVVLVAPALGSAIPAAVSGFRHIDALRGALTTMAVHLLIVHEGQMTIDGHPASLGRSILTAWRLDGGPSDAPAASGTLPGIRHPASDWLRLQWNSPDQLASGQVQSYVVPVTLYLQTRFPDDHVVEFTIRSSFTVSVNFAAESG